MKMPVLEFIELVKSTPGKSKAPGGCLMFFLILKAAYPDAMAFYNSNHVIARIGQKFYDIDGEVTETASYLYYTVYGKNHFRRAFGDYLPVEMIDRMGDD